jgi:hypothetical protein
LLERRGDHTPESYSSEKEVSKHLTVKQIQALQTSISMSPAQSARFLRHNLANFSPEKQIDPLKKIESKFVMCAERLLNFERTLHWSDLPATKLMVRMDHLSAMQNPSGLPSSFPSTTMKSPIFISIYTNHLLLVAISIPMITLRT